MRRRVGYAYETPFNSLREQCAQPSSFGIAGALIVINNRRLRFCGRRAPWPVREIRQRVPALPAKDNFSRNDSDQSAAGDLLDHETMWMPISTAPSDRDLELAVIDDEGTHTLVFPCQKMRKAWKNVATGARVDIRPTHWRYWTADRAPAGDGSPLGDSP